MKESKIQKDIQIFLNKDQSRVFRNHTGKVQCKRTGQWHVFGIPNSGGGSDLLGFVSKTITPEMVGSKVAVFLAIEVKSKTGKVKPEQQRFIDFINEKGGIAGVARSQEDAKNLIQNYKPI